MGETTLKVVFHLNESLQELLIAELDERGFDSFEQVGGRLSAYARSQIWSDDIAEFLTSWLDERGVRPDFLMESIPEQNWNAEWESSLEPIDVGVFTIKPSWVELDTTAERIPVEIDPKMSFGTGYHASTRLVLRLLPAALKSGDRVLDAGTGTGVLAIASAKLGASSVFAFDHDRWSYINALENVRRNHVADVVQVALGDISCVPDESFDVILVNIHLSVIERMMPALIARGAPQSSMLVSGLLVEHRERMMQLAESVGLDIQGEVTEETWYAATLTRSH
jgi:ribosomal protein L11 methyltransferase